MACLHGRAGRLAAENGGFRPRADPSIVGLSIAQGSTAGGAVLEISGTGFEEHADKLCCARQIAEVSYERWKK